ncbi:hypothetical protein PC129_g8698 [Phytophthora cactorum]|uniref:Transmembrane protein n=1 Tax=Phytophthora cactorum TaxID=29920 RepID=A0A329SUE9_9STRA|nr:hypothetical protein Pcac1_g13894 [Phytophthora cactorum]KAG2818661.1 hypothetical protein PC111_g12219 [Phytophthora cactorum]KAG2823160.1 hypothetical protein PC112_g10633 [Phytophthora cactorum]KAG2854159.1 hypothetical protein PC113_g13553 [Phytophthora cactorum]KAG2898415.1 hypothetical protein PC114_g14285 [Phytophthora cactorum]
MSSTGSSDDHSGLHRVNTSSQHDPLPKVEASRPPGVIGDESAGSSTPQAKTLPSTVKQGLTPHPTSRQLATALYHWTTCIFISVLILSQFLGLFWNSVTSEGGALNGSYPVAGGMREIPGDNDKLVTDRVLACVLEGPYYKPVLLNDVLGASGSTVVPETAPPQVDGYRVLRRHGATLSDDAFATYMDTCALISTTLGMILDTCDNDLGYSVTRDGLRIVVDGEKTSGSTSDTVYLIKNALPVLVMPFWDNASIARYAVPGTDGSACLFRLTGKYIDSTLTDGFPAMLAVNRSVRESLTQEWLQASNGKWRHGWLHVGNGDESETAYFSDVISSDPGSTDGLTQREFNTLTKQELDCVNNRKECITSSVSQSWGDKMSTEEQQLTMTSITIASPQHFGFFLFTSTFERTVRVMYDWETLIANVSLGMLLVRWIVVMAALHRGFLQGRSEWFVGGLGCVAGSRSFNMLPIVLLPHLKVTIASFWTAGCYFDGEQIALSESWSTIYPGLAELCLVYYSLLNIFAKITRRRITDIFFAPTLALLCLLHRIRVMLASSGALSGVDGRVATEVHSAEMQELQLVDFFISDVGPRMNANLTLLMSIKLVLVGLNLLPLVFAPYIPPVKQPDTELQGVERALAIRASNVGGLGCSPVYIYGDEKDQRTKIALNSYELVRLGYVVFGGQFLLTSDAWDVIMNTAPLHRRHHLWNYRVVVFPLREKDGYAAVGDKPIVCRLDDARLDSIPFWDIAAQPVKC